MSADFDPYYTWLGIPPEQQPPDHYQLLGLRRFEDNAAVIESAADQRMSFVRKLQAGRHSKLSQQVLNELAAAKLCLLDPQKRAKYDRLLKQRLAGTAVVPLDEASKADEVIAVLQPATGSPRRGSGQQRAKSAPKRAVATHDSVKDPRPRATAKSGTGFVLSKLRKDWRWQAGAGAAVLVLLCAVVGAALLLFGSSGAPPVADNSVGADKANAVAAKSETTSTKGGPVNPQPKNPAGEAGAKPPTPPANETPPQPGPKSVGQQPKGDGSTSDEGKQPPGSSGAGSDTPADNKPFEAAPSDPPDAPDGSPTNNPPSHTPEPPQVAGDPSAVKPAKLPVPPAEQLSYAITRLRDRNQTVFAQATDAAGRATLVNFLLEQGRSLRNDPHFRYAALSEAYDQAVAGSELYPALAAVDAMAAAFDVNAFESKVRAIETVAESTDTVESSKSLAEAALDLISVPTNAQRFEAAEHLVNLADQASQPLNDVPLRKRVGETKLELELLKQQWDEAQTARNTLADRPDDPDANLVYGKYLCLTLGDWNGGLRRLAKGSDPALKAAAEIDLAAPDDSAAQETAGDAWFDLAESSDSLKAFHARSYFWYYEALFNAGALSRVKLTKRLDAIKPFSDGRPSVLAAASTGYTIRAELRHTVSVDDKPASGVVFSADSSKLFSTHDDRIVFWEVATGREQFVLTSGGKRCDTISISPDGTLLAGIFSREPAVSFWNAATGSPHKQIATGHKYGRVIAFSPDGKTLAAASDGKEPIVLLDSSGVRKPAVLLTEPIGTGVIGLAFSPAGDKLAAVGSGKNIAVWQLGRSRILWSGVGDYSRMVGAAFLPGGNQLMTVGYGANVKFWTGDSGKELRSVTIDARVSVFALSPDAKTFVVGNGYRQPGGCSLWDVRTMQRVQTLADQELLVRCVAYSPDGRWLAVGKTEGDIELWALKRVVVPIADSAATLPEPASTDAASPNE